MIVGRRFERERVLLAEEGYERCTFVACELVFDGRPIHLVGNDFDGCSWAFEGAAAVTLDFAASLCRDDPNVRAALARTFGLGAGPSPPRRRPGAATAASHLAATRRPC